MKVTTTIQLAAFVLLATSHAAGQLEKGEVDEMNDVRQICLGMLNYDSAYQHVPARYNVSDQSLEPLLSWRVHILPFIEEMALYSKFKLDEPWNSPHNLQLVEEMPDVFRSPLAKVKAGRTVYLGFEHKRSGLATPRTASATPKGSRLQDFVAGTSNTIIVVRADDEDAVTWTKPDDLDVPSTLSMDPLDRRVNVQKANAALTKKSLFPNGKGKRLVGMMDGSTKRLTPEAFDKQPLTGLLPNHNPPPEAYPVAQTSIASVPPQQMQGQQLLQSSWPVPHSFAANPSASVRSKQVFGATSTINQLTNEALQATDQEQREAKLKQLQKVLEDSFDQEHAKQRKRLESLQKQMAAIEQNLSVREKNRNRLIQNHVDRIRLQAEGLTIPALDVSHSKSIFQRSRPVLERSPASPNQPHNNPFSF